MKYTLIKTGIVIVLLAQCVLCHMPTVYEFCSHVVANGEPIHQLTCDSSQCQGRPGKTGPHGPKGSIGVKGEKGEKGTAEHLEERISELEDFQATTSRILEALPKSTYCYMGVRNRDVPDSAMTSSSISSGGYEAYNGRLDNQISSGNYAVWAAKANRQGEWLQIDFGIPKLIGGIITQGRPKSSRQWVRSFKISCGSSTSSLTTIKHNNSDKIFPGNLDTDSKVINMFTAPITCRYIRVHPESWYGHISMRVEFIHGLCHGMAL